MISRSDARELVEDAFEEVALAIGGLVESHVVDDEIVEKLVQSLARVRGKAVLRIEESPGCGRRGSKDRMPGQPHPAIEEFLIQIGRW